MILFKKLRWKNFLSTGNTFIEIDLDAQPTTLIVGKNGAGKSTILDALTFVLFGKPFRKITKAQVVNSINRSDCMVEVEFSIGSQSYMVRRGIKPNIFEIERNGTNLDQTAVGDFQSYLESSILRLNYKSFTQLVVLGSRSFTPFMQLSTSDRRTVIEDLLDITIFTAMNKLLKERVDTLVKEMDAMDTNIKLIQSKIEMQEGYIDNLKSRKKEHMTKKEASIQENEALIEEANQKIAELSDQIAEQQKLIADKSAIEAKLSKFKEFNIKMDARMSKLVSDIDFFDNNTECPTCKQEIDNDYKTRIVFGVEEDKYELQEAIDKLKGEMSVATDRLGEIQQISDKIVTLNNSIQSENNSISSCNRYIASLRREIEAFENEDGNLEVELDKLEGFRKELVSVQEARREHELLGRDHQIAVAMLKDSGIKTKIVKQYLPVINQLINANLSELNFYANFNLDENFKEEIRSRYRDKFAYANFSEGQKLRIDLAILFTWREIARQKNSMNTNLLFLDEVFDSSLDGEGTEDFMKLLKTLKGNFNTFVISHKTDQLFDKFNRVIKFEQKGNFSSMSSY